MAVKVLDFKDPNFAADFVAQMRHIGAALVINHPVSTDAIKKAYAEWMPQTGGFFGLTDEQKHQFLWSKLSPEFGDPEIGFYPLRSEKGSEHRKNNKGTVNENEYYHIKTGIDGSYPTTSPFAATRKLSTLNAEFVVTLLDILEVHGPDKTQAPYFGDLSKSLSVGKWSTFRWLHYPPYEVAGDPDEDIELIKVHKDKGCITTVISPSEKGLCVEDRDGTYHEVPCIEGAIVVQIGEGLELMSGGYYYAGRHTVRGPRKALAKRRVSAARFWHFTPETRLSADMTNGQSMQKYWQKKGLEAPKEPKS